MAIRQYQLVLKLTFALLATGLSAAFTIAQDAPVQKPASVPDIDATKAEKAIFDALASLDAADRKLAIAQRFCPVTEYKRLGAMGTTVKVMIEGKPVLVCCKECVADAVKKGKETLTKAQKLTDVSAVLAKLTPEDRAAAEAQKYCAIIEGSFLGGMGAPIKLTLNDKSILLCCDGCVAKAKANPVATLAKVETLKKAGTSQHDGHDHQAPKKEAK